MIVVAVPTKYIDAFSSPGLEGWTLLSLAGGSSDAGSMEDVGCLVGGWRLLGSIVMLWAIVYSCVSRIMVLDVDREELALVFWRCSQAGVSVTSNATSRS